MGADPGPLITPWSQLEGLEIAKAIKEAETAGDTEQAERLKEIDRRARRQTGDVPPDYDR